MSKALPILIGGLALLLPLAIALSSKSKTAKALSPSPASLVGYRALFVGDSLSAGANGVGGLLATYVNDNGGDAINHSKSGRNASDLAGIPNVELDLEGRHVFIILGTNDVGRGLKKDIAQFATFYNRAFTNGALSVTIVGAPSFAPESRGAGDVHMTEKGALWASAMEDYFGNAFYDPRDITRDLIRSPYRKGDLIHFTTKGTQLWVERLKSVLF